MTKKLYRLPMFPNLVHTQQVEDVLSTHPAIIHNQACQQKLAEVMKDLNDFGVDKEFHRNPGNIKSLKKGWWEIRVKHQGIFWRILFRKVSPERDNAEYGLIFMYPKKDNQIPKSVWKSASRNAKGEGWL